MQNYLESFLTFPVALAAWNMVTPEQPAQNDGRGYRAIAGFVQGATMSACSFLGNAIFPNNLVGTLALNVLGLYGGAYAAEKTTQKLGRRIDATQLHPLNMLTRQFFVESFSGYLRAVTTTWMVLVCLKKE